MFHYKAKPRSLSFTNILRQERINILTSCLQLSSVSEFRQTDMKKSILHLDILFTNNINKKSKK